MSLSVAMPLLNVTHQAKHTAFVSGHNGTTNIEVLTVSVCGPLSLLLRNLAVPWLFPGWQFNSGGFLPSSVKLLLDFSLTVVPMLLMLTLFAETPTLFLSALAIITATFIMLILFEFCVTYREKIDWKAALNYSIPHQRPRYLTYIRSFLFLNTAISILAVDFPLFPRRFAKTETYGYGWMDMGVGSFIFLHGLFALEIRTVKSSLSKRLLSALPLFVFGVVRLVTVKLSGYHEHVTEYGVHWNFFFTICCVKAIGSALGECIGLRQNAIWAAVLSTVAYEVTLHFGGLQDFLLHGFDGRDRRDDLIDANREGLVSLWGYMTLYLVAIQLGYFLQRPRTKLCQYLLLLPQLSVVCVIAYASLKLCEHIGGTPSRRIANFAYCAWVIFTNLFIMICCLCVELVSLVGAALKLPVFSSGDNPFDQLDPCLWRRVGDHGLLYFLLANLLTGLINFAVATVETSDQSALLILVSYLFVLSLIVFLFRK